MTDNTNNSSNLNNPHDKFFKAIFSLRSVVHGFLVRFLSKDILDKLDLSTLEVDTTSYVSADLSTFYADIVWRCRFKKGYRQSEAGFIFEHKSYKPTYPHFQLWDYKRGAWQIQLSSKQPLVSMVPFILYHGQEAWQLESFDHYFGEIEPEMLRFMPCFDIILVNLQHISDEEMCKIQPVFLQKALLALAHAWDIAYFKNNLVKLWLADYENTQDEETIFFIRAFGVYLAEISGVSRDEIKQQIIKFNNDLKSNVMTFIEEFIEEGIEKGIEEGIEKGKKISIYEAWQRGNGIELLANVFALSESTIKHIIAEMTIEKR